MPRIRRRMAYIALAIAITLTIGTTGFVVIEHYPLLDAFYMSVTTITTVGYKEVHDLSTAGRIFSLWSLR